MLSWPRWPVTHRDGLPAHRWSHPSSNPSVHESHKSSQVFRVFHLQRVVVLLSYLLILFTSLFHKFFLLVHVFQRATLHTTIIGWHYSSSTIIPHTYKYNLFLFSPPINAQNPLDTFPHRRGSCQLVADLLATRHTILTYQDVANKSAISWKQIVVMEFGKWHDTTNIMHFCSCHLVMD